MRVWLARRMADGAVHCIHLRRQGAVLSRLAFALATGCGADRGSRTKSARGAVAFLPQSAHYRRELFARCEQRLDGPSASGAMRLRARRACGLIWKSQSCFRLDWRNGSLTVFCKKPNSDFFFLPSPAKGSHL